MSVLHINSNYEKSSLYSALSESLLNQGCNIKTIYPVAKNYKRNNLENHVHLGKILNKYDRYLFKYRARKILRYIEKNIDFNKYLLTHAHSLFSNGYISYLLKKKYNIPYIVAVRNTDLNRYFKKIFFLRSLGVDILKEASTIVLLSQPYKELLLENYIPFKYKDIIERKIKIIPNGIDEFWHKNVFEKKRKKPKSRVNILSVGTINENKNIFTSIKAAEILINQGKDVQLNVIGAVRDQDVLDRIKKSCFVNYQQPIAKERLIEFYRGSDLFLMPSITETFGLVYAEAMSQGLPVLYSKGQGFDEQFPDGTVGYAVEKMDPVDIANKISLTLDNYHYISKNCIDLVERFDWERISKKYINIYKDIEGFA